SSHGRPSDRALAGELRRRAHQCPLPGSQYLQKTGRMVECSVISMRGTAESPPAAATLPAADVRSKEGLLVCA
ncbi:hypothetical protein, partial [Halorubrum gandharaense]